MTNQEINISVLQQLQEFARFYFDEIVQTNTTAEGVCTLAPGRYSAKEMSDNSYKSVFGHAYALPEDAIFDEPLTVTAGEFSCTFLYRNIFAVLTAWEAMMRAGRKKAVFEIGGIEERTAKVIIDEATPTGKFVERRVRLQRIHGNWWAPRKKVGRGGAELYYDLNGVFFMPGKRIWSDDDKRSESTRQWCSLHDDERTAAALISASAMPGDAGRYWLEVAARAGVAVETPHPAAPQATETPLTTTPVAEVGESANESETPGAGDFMQEFVRSLNELRIDPYKPRFASRRIGKLLSPDGRTVLDEARLYPDGRFRLIVSYDNGSRNCGCMDYTKAEFRREFPPEAMQTTKVEDDLAEDENKPTKHISELISNKRKYYDRLSDETLLTTADPDGHYHTFFDGIDIGVDLSAEEIWFIPGAVRAQVASELKEMYDYIHWLEVEHMSVSEYFLNEVRESIAECKWQSVTRRQGETRRYIRSSSRIHSPRPGPQAHRPAPPVLVAPGEFVRPREQLRAPHHHWRHTTNLITLQSIENHGTIRLHPRQH